MTEMLDSLSFAQAAVLPLAIATACSDLYHPEYLNLPLPSATDTKSRGRGILIWGGVSSVGATAIQLAAASALTVITTASPANHDTVKSLGAHIILDYRSPSVVDDIVSELRACGKFVGVYDAISEDSSFAAIFEIVNHLDSAVPVTCVLPLSGQRTEKFAPKFGKPAGLFLHLSCLADMPGYS